MPQDTNVAQNWWFSGPPSAWPCCSASLGLAVPQANERTAWVVVCSEFSWEMGGQETPYTFVPLFSFIQCTSLCPHQWDSVYVNETLSDLSLRMGKLGNASTISAVLLYLSLIFVFVQCPRLLPYLPTLHSNSSLSLHGKGCFLYMLGEIYDLSLPGMVIDILKPSRLWTGLQGCCLSEKPYFALEGDITLLFGCHFFSKTNFDLPLGKWVVTHTEKGKLLIILKWLHPPCILGLRGTPNYSLVQNSHHLTLALGMNCSQYKGPLR